MKTWINNKEFKKEKTILRISKINNNWKLISTESENQNIVENKENLEINNDIFQIILYPNSDEHSIFTINFKIQKISRIINLINLSITSDKINEIKIDLKNNYTLALTDFSTLLKRKYYNNHENKHILSSSFNFREMLIYLESLIKFSHYFIILIDKNFLQAFKIPNANDYEFLFILNEFLIKFKKNFKCLVVEFKINLTNEEKLSLKNFIFCINAEIQELINNFIIELPLENIKEMEIADYFLQLQNKYDKIDLNNYIFKNKDIFSDAVFSKSIIKTLSFNNKFFLKINDKKLITNIENFKSIFPIEINNEYLPYFLYKTNHYCLIEQFSNQLDNNNLFIVNSNEFFNSMVNVKIFKTENLKSLLTTSYKIQKHYIIFLVDYDNDISHLFPSSIFTKRRSKISSNILLHYEDILKNNYLIFLENINILQKDLTNEINLILEYFRKLQSEYLSISNLKNTFFEKTVLINHRNNFSYYSIG